MAGRDSRVGITTRHGLGGSGFEPCGGARFHPSRQDLGIPAPMQWIRVLPGVKAAGTWRGVDHPHSSSAEVKESEDLNPQQNAKINSGLIYY